MSQFHQCQTHKHTDLQILHQVFGFLESRDDLFACYGVCRLWKSIVPEYIVSTLSPITLRKTQSVRRYLSVVQTDPKLLAAPKLVFQNMNLNSPSMQKLLKLVGTRNNGA